MEKSVWKGKTGVARAPSQREGCVDLGGFGMKSRRQRRNGVTKTDDGGKSLFDVMLLEAERRALKSPNGSTDSRNCALRRFERAVLHGGLRIRCEIEGPCQSSKEVKGHEKALSDASSSPRSDTNHDGASSIQPLVESRSPERNAAASALLSIRRGLPVSSIGPKTLIRPVNNSKRLNAWLKELHLSTSVPASAAAATNDVNGAVVESTAELRLLETKESQKAKRMSESGESAADFQDPRVDLVAAKSSAHPESKIFS